MKIHHSITQERVMEAVERQLSSLDNPGICIACGADADGCEPDAREYVCEVCGKPSVYGVKSCSYPSVFGAEESFFMIE